MKITLTDKEKLHLEFSHQYACERRVADRIKAILLRSEGWSISKIAQVLRLHNDTVSRYVTEYLESKQLTSDDGGSTEKLNDEQTKELISHLEEKLYSKASDVLVYVEERFGVKYTLAGMTDGLKRHEFSYKQTKGQPSKGNPKEQEKFVKKYKQLKAKTPENEPIVFIDVDGDLNPRKSSEFFMCLT